ncbi:HlyD family secretion protein [Desertibaculum subflavum]|uniref:HlyD family secretion protein n=1 Tax=Desertibaculum subflavum TaxID=2268458 RepID=UPI0034D181D0
MIRKILLSILLVAALAAGSYWGWGWWQHGRFVESTDNAYVEANLTVIAPKVAGYVAEVAVAENQGVKAGDVLAVIDDSDYRIRLAQAEAKLATARAGIQSAETRLTLNVNLVAEAQAVVAAAEADLAHALLEVNRYRSLSEQNIASRQRYDTAQTDHRKAVAARDRVRAALASQVGQVQLLTAQRREAEAQAMEAQAALAAAKLDLDNTTIRAPADGIVGNRSVQTGQYVRPGAQMMVLVPTGSTYVVANFKETQLARMRPGQAVAVTVDAFRGARLAGHIESFAPASGAKFSLLPPENATGNFTKIVQRVPVRIRLADDDPLVRRLVPGLSVEVAVDTRAEAAKVATPNFGIGAPAGAGR